MADDALRGGEVLGHFQPTRSVVTLDGVGRFRGRSAWGRGTTPRRERPAGARWRATLRKSFSCSSCVSSAKNVLKTT